MTTTLSRSSAGTFNVSVDGVISEALAVAVLLALSAAAASWLPARRAARTEPHTV